MFTYEIIRYLQMKWSLTLLSATWSPAAPMMHSLQSVHALGLATATRFSPAQYKRVRNEM